MNNSSADLKPSLIDLEVGNTTTGDKQEFDSVQSERLSERGNMYCVYWIHLDTHKNMYEEGYIGITSNFKKRMQSHSEKLEKDNVFKKAIKLYKWNNLIKDIIHNNITLKEALNLELKYRPLQNIGWNSQIGGKIGVEKEWYLIETNKLKHSLKTSIATKKAIALKDTKEARSLRAKICNAKYKEKYSKSLRGSNNPKAKLDETQVFKIKFELIPNNYTNEQISLLYDVQPYVIEFIRKNKTWKHVVCDSPDYK